MLTLLLAKTASQRPAGPTDLSGGLPHSKAGGALLETPAPPSWQPLPLGSIAPQGWLLEQLLTQANALSGFMPTSTFPGAIDVNTSLWIGGNLSSGTDQWLPYWANGNVPLLMLIRAANATNRLDPSARLEQVVESIVNYVRHAGLRTRELQTRNPHRTPTRDCRLANSPPPRVPLQVLGHVNKTSGWVGPYLNEPGDSNGHGLWDPLNMLRALLMYAEGTPAASRAVAAAVVSHLTAEYALLKTDPVYKWASTRWPTFVQVCLYVVDTLVPRFGDDPAVMPLGAKGTTALLLNASRLFETKGMDWAAYYSRTGKIKFPLGSVPNWNTNDHGVNNAEGALAWPAMAYRLHGNASEGHAAMALVLRMIDTYQATPNALLCADEVFCGRAPHRGTETCAVVEAMASLEQGFAVLGEPSLFDRVERLAFNALPAALTADMWTHVYVQQANSVFAGKTKPVPWGDVTEPAELVEGGEEEGGGGLQDTPSGEDQGSNFYGVSHFPCCITNFPQGWPKFAASAVMAAADGRAAFVVASLVPLRATLPFGGTVQVDGPASRPLSARWCLTRPVCRCPPALPPLAGGRPVPLRRQRHPQRGAALRVARRHRVRPHPGLGRHTARRLESSRKLGTLSTGRRAPSLPLSRALGGCVSGQPTQRSTARPRPTARSSRCRARAARRRACAWSCAPRCAWTGAGASWSTLRSRRRRRPTRSPSAAAPLRAPPGRGSARRQAIRPAAARPPARRGLRDLDRRRVGVRRGGGQLRRAAGGHRLRRVRLGGLEPRLALLDRGAPVLGRGARPAARLVGLLEGLQHHRPAAPLACRLHAARGPVFDRRGEDPARALWRDEHSHLGISVE